ncbi:hypothetical protein PY91_05605 [Lacticaseibacillus rhamnosus]|nr:hypothetical protein PY91_05605 [Lacticaseibacillus rhamnosus]
MVLTIMALGTSPVAFAGTSVAAAEVGQVTSVSVPINNSSAISIDPQANLVSKTVTEDGMHVSLTYKVNAEELANIKKLYSVLNRSTLARSTFGTMSVNANSYTSTKNGSFKKSTTAGIAGILTGMAGLSISYAFQIAAVLLGSNVGDTVYYHYTQTSWSASDGFHVRVNIKFYRDASHKSYITQTTFDRLYQND